MVFYVSLGIGQAVLEYRYDLILLRRARYGRYDITRRKTNQTIDGRFSCTRRGHSKISAVLFIARKRFVV